MMHTSLPSFSTQLHPDAKGGPMDTAFLIDIYQESVRTYKDGKHLPLAINDHRVS